MPALPATPSGVMRCRLIHTLQTTIDVGCKFDVHYTGDPPSTTDLTSFASQISSEWGGDIPPILSQNCNLSNVVCLDLATPGTVEGEFPAIIDGTRTGNLPTLASCTDIIFKPDRRYRGSRPRMATPYGVEADVVNGNKWNSIFLAAVDVALGTFWSNVAAMTAGGTNLGGLADVSYYHGFTVVTNPVTGRVRNVPTLRTTPLVNDVVSHSPREVIGSQRKRLTAL